MPTRMPQKLACLLLPGLLLGALCCWQPAVAVESTASPKATAPGDRFTPTALLPVRLAQAQVPLGTIPTDITPVDVGTEARGVVDQGWKFRMLQKLPPRLWFNLTTEVSQRLDTNVFFTYNKPKQDYAFRALPNVSVGYSLFDNTSIYCNYFVIKDLFAAHGNQLSFPTTQSLALGLRQDFEINRRTFAQIDFQSRELWQATRLRQADLLPAINITRLLAPGAAAFGSVVLQLRGAEYFTGPTREIDPFYSVGLLYRRGNWSFVATNTLVTNFHRKNAIPSTGNVSMIADFEVSRPVWRQFPALVTFIRAEPIFNWSSHKAPGLSGIDFRLFGGLRLTMNKPSYAAQVSKLKKQLIESEPLAKPGGKPSTPSLAPQSPPPSPSPSSPPSPPPSPPAGGSLNLAPPNHPLAEAQPRPISEKTIRMFISQPPAI